MWNLKNKQTQENRYREQTGGCQRWEVEDRQNGEEVKGVICVLKCISRIRSLYSPILKHELYWTKYNAKKGSFLDLLGA